MLNIKNALNLFKIIHFINFTFRLNKKLILICILGQKLENCQKIADFGKTFPKIIFNIKKHMEFIENYSLCHIQIHVNSVILAKCKKVTRTADFLKTIIQSL